MFWFFLARVPSLLSQPAYDISCTFSCICVPHVCCIDRLGRFSGPVYPPPSPGTSPPIPKVFRSQSGTECTTGLPRNKQGWLERIALRRRHYIAAQEETALWINEKAQVRAGGRGWGVHSTFRGQAGRLNGRGTLSAVLWEVRQVQVGVKTQYPNAPIVRDSDPHPMGIRSRGTETGLLFSHCWKVMSTPRSLRV